jgi:hypothetical protein
MMRDLNKAELESTSGGVIALTGIAAGLEASGVIGAVGLAWGIGWGIGTGIYAGYNYLRYGEA